MDLDVTVCAIGVLRVQIMLRTGRLDCADIVGNAVAGQAKLRHPARIQQPRICGAVRRVTRAASFSLNRRMFVNKRALLVRVTLDTSRIGASRQSRLFEFKTAMGVMAVAAFHRAFENLMVER